MCVCVCVCVCECEDVNVNVSVNVNVNVNVNAVCVRVCWASATLPHARLSRPLTVQTRLQPPSPSRPPPSAARCHRETGTGCCGLPVALLFVSSSFSFTQRPPPAQRQQPAVATNQKTPRPPSPIPHRSSPLGTDPSALRVRDSSLASYPGLVLSSGLFH